MSKVKKLTNQQAINRILAETNLETSIEYGLDGYSEIVLPNKIKTKNGYYQHCLCFSFDKKGRLDDISISINDYQLLPSQKFADVINRVKVKRIKKSKK